jgi:serine/threonine protein phosphatase 1
MPRTIAIADIHGCSDALASILRAIAPQPDDTLICLGDYVDRGMDSKGVLDMLIELSRCCRFVPILGNHDEMMLKARESKSALREWMEFGGIATLDSYGSSGQIDLIPDEHFEFVESCLPSFETDTHFFVHANYDPELPLDQQDERTLRWLSLRDSVPGPHVSGKIAVVGHTPQPNILNLGHLICLDTGCAYGGTLTAMEMGTEEVSQSTTMQ